MFELAINQEIQQKVRASVIEVLKKHDNQLTYEAINEMHYLEQCVNGELSLLKKIRIK